jgi:hypothetical protein
MDSFFFRLSEGLLLVAFVVGISVCLTGQAWGQPDDEISVSVQAQPSEVGAEETVTFTIEVRGAPLSAIETPEPPRTSNLLLREPTPSTEREVSFKSGRFTRHVTFEWTYAPMRVGVGRLESTEVRIRGERYRTDEVRVRIVPQSQRPARTPRAQSRSVSPPSQNGAPDAPGLKHRDLFIQATASTDTAYENEQVTVEYRLFFRPGVRLRQSRMADAWDAPGFWREELDVASRPTPRSTTLNGQSYEAIVLKRVALFPTQTGRLEIDPLQIETEAQARPQLGQRDPAARSAYEPVTLSSEKLEVVVEPLPPNSPSAFDGSVGTFGLETDVSTDSVEVGEAVELTARVQGTGNLATLTPPLLEPPSDFETYDSSVTIDLDRSSSVVKGTKTFRYTLVPQSNGHYTLPPVRFAYFDPDAGQYETLQSEPVALHVTGDVPPDAVSRTGEGLPIGDIAGPMEVERWVRVDRPPLYAQPWAYVAMLVPVVLAGGALAYRRFQEGSAKPVSDPSALEAAQSPLQVAHQRLREGNERGFYEAVERSVLTFFDARIDDFQPASGRTRETLDQYLSQHDVPDPDRTALRELLDACDEAQFSPTDPSYDAMEATLDHAQGLLRRLDDTLPRSADVEGR